MKRKNIVLNILFRFVVFNIPEGEERGTFSSFITQYRETKRGIGIKLRGVTQSIKRNTTDCAYRVMEEA